MPKCRGCDNAEAKLRCLICEQTEELTKEKHTSYQFPEIIKQQDDPFPQLNDNERTIWVLYLAKYTEQEIAEILFVTQSTISRCITDIRTKL